MALSKKRAEAEQLYVRKGLPCPAIAAELGVNEGTVYGWKKDAAEKGADFDWDTKRKAYNISPRELVALYSETIKGYLLKISRNPELLTDTKIADAIAKHVSVLKKLDTRAQYLGAITDFIEVTNRWLQENNPEIKKLMDPLWEHIYQELVNSYTQESLFS
jgi:transposase